MVIDFDKINPQIAQNFKGGENTTVIKKFEDKNNRIMKVNLKPKASIGYHKHEQNSEIIFIIKGCAKATYDDETKEILSAGDCHYCPKGHSHSLSNQGDEDLIFLAIVSN